jgi:hypothetical protein
MLSVEKALGTPPPDVTPVELQAATMMPEASAAMIER